MTFRPAPKPQKPERGTGRAKEHLKLVKMLPCRICRRHPVDAHHCIHDRHAQRRASDFEVIPLCHDHHQGTPYGIHAAPEMWRKRWGEDHSYLPGVFAEIAEIKRNTI